MRYLFLTITLLLSLLGSAKSSKVYKSVDFKFSVSVPKTWSLYGEKIEIANKRMLIDWGLPKVSGIENSISIQVFKDKSKQNLITQQYLDMAGNCALEIENGGSDQRIVYCTRNGVEYKGKLYFVEKNKIAYLISFMASPNTYTVNLPVFEKFYKSLKFQ